MGTVDVLTKQLQQQQTIAGVPNLTRNVPNLTGHTNVPKVEESYILYREL